MKEIILNTLNELNKEARNIKYFYQEYNITDMSLSELLVYVKKHKIKTEQVFFGMGSYGGGMDAREITNDYPMVIYRANLSVKEREQQIEKIFLNKVHKKIKFALFNKGYRPIRGGIVSMSKEEILNAYNSNEINLIVDAYKKGYSKI